MPTLPRDTCAVDAAVLLAKHAAVPPLRRMTLNDRITPTLQPALRAWIDSVEAKIAPGGATLDAGEPVHQSRDLGDAHVPHTQIDGLTSRLDSDRQHHGESASVDDGDAYGLDTAGPCAVNTTLPPTIVYNTLAFRIESGGTVMISRDSTVISAHFPGVSEPFSWSWKAT